MATWSLLYAGNELNISNRNPYDLVSISGIGTAPLRQLEERAPFQDGASNIGFRLDPRTINFVLMMNASDKAQADTYRDALYEYLKGLPTSIQLRCVKDNGTIRQIDCYTTGMVDAPVDDQNRIGASQRFAIQLRAPNPVWYDPTPSTWGLLGGTSTGLSGYRIPMSIPWVQTAATSIDRTDNLAYSGSWDEYPVITIFGPGSNFLIENTLTGDILDFSSLVLTNGQYVEIDLRYGRKSIVDQAGNNRIADLSDRSDLATFRLMPAPFAPSGANAIRFYVGNNATSSTGIRFIYYNRFTAL